MSELAHGTHLLLVEDDKDIRETLAEILVEEGYQVRAAKDGREALRSLDSAEQLPALILLDLMMPVMDGWKFREEQRKNAAWADIPIVVISADGRVADRLDSIDAAAYVRKPLDIEELVEVIARAARPRPEPSPTGAGGPG